jgi:hypothetical protein
MKSIKVRFNLGRGKNYMKWKVEHPDKRVEYLDPNAIQLTLHGCKLKNNPKTAERIHQGQHKTVCAWVLCDRIEVTNGSLRSFQSPDSWVYYNPKNFPNWVFQGQNADGFHFSTIMSFGNKLHVIL